MKLMLPFKIPDLSPREKLFAMAGAMGLSLVLLDQLVFGPWWRHMRRVEREIQTLELSIASEHQLLNRKDKVLADIVAYQDRLRLAGPKENEIANLLREIESLGGESGVTLGEVKPLPTEDGGPYQVRSFEIQCEGTLPELVRFLYLIQTAPSLFGMDQSTVEIKEQGSARLKGTFRVTSLAVEAPPGFAPAVAPAQPGGPDEEESSPAVSGGTSG